MSETKTHSYSSTELARAQTVVGKWQSNLLDLSKGNRLLLFRTTKLSTIPFEQPGIATAFKWLVQEDRKVSIDSIQKEELPSQLQLAVEEAGVTDSASLFSESLCTSLKPDRLQNTLYNLRQKARSSIEERGVNVLYLALAFVVWKDPQETNLEWRAPLILLPVTIDRPAPEKYTLSMLDEDVILNPTLAYKLEREFRIRLPDLPDDLDNFELEAYLARTRDAIAELNNATVHLSQNSNVSGFDALRERNSKSPSHCPASRFASRSSRTRIGIDSL